MNLSVVVIDAVNMGIVWLDLLLFGSFVSLVGNNFISPFFHISTSRAEFDHILFLILILICWPCCSLLDGHGLVVYALWQVSLYIGRHFTPAHHVFIC